MQLQPQYLLGVTGSLARTKDALNSAPGPAPGYAPAARQLGRSTCFPSCACRCIRLASLPIRHLTRRRRSTRQLASGPPRRTPSPRLHDRTGWGRTEFRPRASQHRPRACSSLPQRVRARAVAPPDCQAPTLLPCRVQMAPSSFHPRTQRHHRTLHALCVFRATRGPDPRTGCPEAACPSLGRQRVASPC